MSKRFSDLILISRLVSRPQGVGVKELSERLGITERSVYNDLIRLGEMGLLLYSEKDPSNPKRKVYKSFNSSADVFSGILPLGHFSEDDRDTIKFLSSFDFGDENTRKKVLHLLSEIDGLSLDLGLRIA